jgi:hypothetical protein
MFTLEVHQALREVFHMRTVVGFFDKYGGAEGLANALIEKGFTPENIELGRTTKGEAFIGSSEEIQEGVRGYYPPEGPHGEEAFVALHHASDTEAMLARDIMSGLGVAEIDERPED